MPNKGAIQFDSCCKGAYSTLSIIRYAGIEAKGISHHMDKAKSKR